MIIKILPMDKKGEFHNAPIEDIQNNFFLKDLPSRFDDNGNGKYCYKKAPMSIDDGTLVFFQYDSYIVAMATLTNMIKYNKIEYCYVGAYYFEPSSIRIFKPISNKKFNKIFNCKLKFSHIKHKIEVENFDDIIKNNFEDIKSMDVNVYRYKKSTCR